MTTGTFSTILLDHQATGIWMGWKTLEYPANWLWDGGVNFFFSFFRGEGTRGGYDVLLDSDTHLKAGELPQSVKNKHDPDSHISSRRFSAVLVN